MEGQMKLGFGWQALVFKKACSIRRMNRLLMQRSHMSEILSQNQGSLFLNMFNSLTTLATIYQEKNLGVILKFLSRNKQKN